MNSSPLRQRGPDRDSPREWLRLGLIGLAFVLGGVLFGMRDPAPRAGAPTRTSSPPAVTTATPDAIEDADDPGR